MEDDFWDVFGVKIIFGLFGTAMLGLLGFCIYLFLKHPIQMIFITGAVLGIMALVWVLGSLIFKYVDERI